MNVCSCCGKPINRGSVNCAVCAKVVRRCNSYISPAPYAGCLTALPYVAPIHGRRIVRYTDCLGKKRSTSLARYLMSLHLGYIPSRDMDVDHIDQDPTNDRVSNLQLVSKSDNLAKGGTHHASAWLIKASCVVCGRDVTKRGRISYFPPDSIFSCSRVCAGSISHMRKNMELDELRLRNNATDTVSRKTCVTIQDSVTIDQPSFALLSVLEMLRDHGHDYYPES